MNLDEKIIGKTIFWNVDTQYDFMREDGKLNVANAQGIEPKLEELTRYAADKNLQVVNTADWHYDNSPELSDNPDFINTFPPHCMANTTGAEYVPATKPLDAYVVDWDKDMLSGDKVRNTRNVVVRKDAFNVFEGNKYADAVLSMINPDNVVVYGVATNVCVNQAVNGLLERGKNVYVPTDAIKELPNLPLDEVLDEWKQKGAILTTVDDLVNKYLQ